MTRAIRKVFMRHRAMPRLLSLVVGAQTIIQLIAALAGLLVVRGLEPKQYGLYTLAISALSVISVISESGFGASILALAGPIHDEAGRVRAIFALAVSKRLPLAIAMSTVVGPGLLLLLVRNGASVPVAVAVVLATLAQVGVSIRVGLLQVVLQLRRQIRKQQAAAVTAGAVRLALLVPLLVSQFGLLTALIGNLAGVALEYYLLSRALAVDLPTLGVSAESDWPYMRRLVIRLLPLSTFTVFQTTILYFILGSRAQTTGLAKVAALTRYSVAFTVIATAWGAVLIPAFARTAKTGKSLGKLYLGIVAAYAIASSIILGLMGIASAPLLAILGTHYAHLSRPLLELSAAGSISNLGGIIAYLNQARGWISLNWTVIPTSLGSVLAGLYLFDVTNLNGAADFTLFTATLPAIVKLAPVIAHLFVNHKFRSVKSSTSM